MLKTYQKITGLVLALCFLTVMLFGINIGMDMRQDGTMSGCAFDSSVTCPMGYEDHVNHWQQTFIAVQPTQNMLTTVLLILSLDGAMLLFSLLQNNWRRHSPETHYLPQAIHRQREIIAKLSDHILRAVSRGKLNPRLYNFSHTIS